MTCRCGHPQQHHSAPRPLPVQPGRCRSLQPKHKGSDAARDLVKAKLAQPAACDGQPSTSPNRAARLHSSACLFFGCCARQARRPLIACPCCLLPHMPRPRQGMQARAGHQVATLPDLNSASTPDREHGRTLPQADCQRSGPQRMYLRLLAWLAACSQPRVACSPPRAGRWVGTLPNVRSASTSLNVINPRHGVYIPCRASGRDLA